MESQQLKILRKPEVLALIGLSSTSFYRHITEGLLPQSFSLGCRAVGWYEHEINAVIKARAAGHTEQQIKKLVAEQMSARQQAA